MASDADERRAKIRAEMDAWCRRAEAAARVLADLSDATDRSEVTDAQRWFTHCQEKQAAIARMLDELENPPCAVAKLDSYRKQRESGG